MFVRPPRDLKGVSAGELWQILKSAYGLSEAPRLWYEKAKEDLLSCGFIELVFAPATFIKLVKRAGRNVVVAILCLHVDDGFLTAERGKVLEEVQQSINNLFSIKEWIQVTDKPTAYLGMQIYRKDGFFFNDMTEYILAVKKAAIPERDPETPLTVLELKEFRRMVAQLRWPVHLVCPEFLFRVSALAQRVSGAKLSDLADCTTLLSDLQDAARQGRALLKLRGISGDPILISFFDASLGKTGEAVAQRGEAHFISSFRSARRGQGFSA